MNKILLIDDDERLGGPLTNYLAKFQLALSCATHPKEGLELLKREQFELLVLDVMLPEANGFEVCKMIRRKSNIPIVMLSARGEVNDRLVGLELGADDYLAKPFEPRELVVRIQNILKRNQQTAHTKNTIEYQDLIINKSMQEVTVAGKPVDLTSNEFQLLTMLASSPGRNFSRDDILGFLKGIKVELYTRAVDIQISRLRQKLKPTDYIKTVWGSGYRFVAPGTE